MELKIKFITDYFSKYDAYQNDLSDESVNILYHLCCRDEINESLILENQCAIYYNHTNNEILFNGY